VNRRQTGQLVAGALAALCFGCAIWAARSAAIPELRVYDGFLMLLGAAIVVGLVAPLVWRWPRERSVLTIALAAVFGCIVPLGISALHHHMPVAARLRGAWMIGGADLVGPPVVIGFVSLWFALREYRRSAPGRTEPTTQ
jgi:hypothetical protein